jgi:hypothetical protein
MSLTRGKILGYVKIIRSIGGSDNEPWFLPGEVTGENQGLHPVIQVFRQTSGFTSATRKGLTVDYENPFRIKDISQHQK